MTQTSYKNENEMKQFLPLFKQAPILSLSLTKISNKNKQQAINDQTKFKSEKLKF